MTAVGSVIYEKVFKNRPKFIPLEAQKWLQTCDIVPLSEELQKYLFKSGRKAQELDHFLCPSGTKILKTGF